MACAPAKTQISLGIRPVWSESLLSAGRKLGSLAAHWAHSEDSDQSGQIPRLIWVFAGRSHFVGFVMRGLISCTGHDVCFSYESSCDVKIVWIFLYVYGFIDEGTYEWSEHLNGTQCIYMQQFLIQRMQKNTCCIARHGSKILWCRIAHKPATAPVDIPLMYYPP